MKIIELERKSFTKQNICQSYKFQLKIQKKNKMSPVNSKIIVLKKIGFMLKTSGKILLKITWIQIMPTKKTNIFFNKIFTKKKWVFRKNSIIILNNAHIQYPKNKNIISVDTKTMINPPITPLNISWIIKMTNNVVKYLKITIYSIKINSDQW